MKDRKPEILYSDPVKEIMGNPPSRILRWGNGVMVLVFLLFIIFSWLIKYPDKIPSPVEITTMNPPVTLVAQLSGPVKDLKVNDREVVKAGQLLAVIGTSASMDEIELLHQTIDTIRKPESLSSLLMPGFSELAELQRFYAAFIKALSDLNNYKTNDFNGNKIKSLTDELNGIQQYIYRLKSKEELFLENQTLETKKYERHSRLFDETAIAEAELELAYQSLLEIKMKLVEVRLEISAKSIEMAEKRQEIVDNQIIKQQDEDKLVSILRESFLNLKAEKSIWINNYLLISPVDGRVSFTGIWAANQSVVKDESVINVVPIETGSLVGRINLKMLRSGKVKTGQIVNIKLSSYPYMEYGMVRGIVKSKSLVPSRDQYIIEIDIPEGLTTSYKEKLEFTQNMQGTAEIITDDIRLLQKIVNPFRYLFSKNKR